MPPEEKEDPTKFSNHLTKPSTGQAGLCNPFTRTSKKVAYSAYAQPRFTIVTSTLEGDVQIVHRSIIFTRSSDFECLRKRKTIQRTFQITSQNLQLDKLRLRVIMTLTVCVSVEARCTITFICRALTFHLFVFIPPTYENRLEVVEVARPRSVSLSIILSHPTF